ncbi:MAG: hypothetical protein IT353_19135 [Gemmatimonadaceae bacterium]|nr:hypothetical protein [Gemmatimonadaceae bacterium]
MLLLQILAGTLVASNMDARSVSIVDVASGAAIATVATGEGPHEVAISRDGRRAVVSIYGNRAAVGSSLAVIDLRTPTAPPRVIELGPGNRRPHGMAFLPDDTHLLVTGEQAQRVLVVNVETGAIDSTMSTGQATTHMIALTRDGRTAYTTNLVAMSVSRLDVATRTVSAPFMVGARIEGIAVTPDGREVWVGGNDTQRVFVLDGQTGVVRDTIVGFGFPYRIGITPDARTAVVSDPGAEKIHLIDVATRRVRKVIEVARMEGGLPSSPQGVAISPDGRLAFVTLKAAAQVAVVDLASGTILKTLRVGAGSDGVGVTAGHR